MNKQQLIQTFYDIQKKQWRRSVALFGFIFLFYTIFVALFVFPIGIPTLAFMGKIKNGIPWITLSIISLCISTIIAIYHFYEARYKGAEYLIKLLQASRPDPTDSYHKQFVNLIDEIKVATGIQNIKGFVMLSAAVNSLGMILPDKSLGVFVSEGMLDKCKRAELQAAIAHEVAHLIRGDTFYIGLLCSLAAFFENIRSSLEDSMQQERRTDKEDNPLNGIVAFFYILSLISSMFMKLMSTFISREREILADATAVEITRDPASLASAIYKANYFYSQLGTSNTPYTPLFLASPDSCSYKMDLSFFERIASTHPPAMKRVTLLCNMARVPTSEIMNKVKDREQEDIHPEILASEDIAKPDVKDELEELTQKKTWRIRNSKGQWQGPFLLDEIVFQPYFTALIQVENMETGEIMAANKHKEVVTRLRGTTEGNNKCPHCNIPLKTKQYEGVQIKHCERCLGHFASRANVRKILIRSKYTFSDKLHKKAHEFTKNNMLNPMRNLKANQLPKKLVCPNCGGGMHLKPFNYQFFVQVDDCLSCNHIWFDADELEILQILIEERLKSNY